MPSLLLYNILWSLLLSAAYFSSRSKRKLTNNGLLWLSIAVVSLIVGLRWEGVGSDHYNYYTVITGEAEYYELDRLEPFPRFLMIACNWLGLPFYSWFIIMAFLQLLFLVLSANNGLQKIFPWMVLIFFANIFPLSLIIMRQVAAISILLYAYTFINQKRIVPYFALVSLAIGFHFSAAICLPLYWIIPLLNIRQVWVQLLIVSFFLLLGERLVSMLWAPIAQLDVRYSAYVGREFEYGTRSGLGVIVAYIRYFFLILYSNRLKKEYNTSGFSIFYAFSFVFICIYNGIKEDEMLSRMSMLFSVADLVTLGSLFHYLSHSKRKEDHVVFCLLFSMLAIVMVYTAYMGEPWNFVWQISSIRQ